MIKGKTMLETGYIYAPYIVHELEPVMYVDPIFESLLFLINGI